MEKAKRKVQMPAGVRNKLMAAVSMLLVSSIMMVSSTYAWFTLSTAPEVTDIKTTVAGNGSLEIALVPKDGTLTITSGRNTSGDAALANRSWGNIIDLASESYGLGDISLNPALLATKDSGAELSDRAKVLSIAGYGADGRVTKLVDDNMALKSYTDKKVWDGGEYGVRAIGEYFTSGDGSSKIVRFSSYGYTVDLAFRLNTTNTVKGGSESAESTYPAGKLQLQTEGAQRIYSDSQNTETLGGGSFMSFNSNTTGLKLDDLMKAVRVTFVKNLGYAAADANTVVVLGTARLDTEKVTVNGDISTASLYLYNAEGAKLESKDLVELVKNTATQVSAVVWLDGAAIKNASVSAYTSALAKSTLNLQFTTDVELKPAQNSSLKATVEESAAPEVVEEVENG